MGTGYVRNDTSNNIADASVINASDLDGEFDALLAAFNSSTGHTHDGTTAEGAAVTVVGPAQDYVGAAGDFSPKTDSAYDLGKTAVRWATAYFDTLDTELDAIVSTSDLPIAKGGTGAGTASGAIANLGITATAAELNYNDITTLGSSEASKVVTADANGDVILLQELKATSYNESYVAVTSSSNATAVDCEAGNTFMHTLTEATTFTFSNPPATGTAYSMSIEIIQDAGASGFAVTWPTITWPTATTPTITATANAVDVFVFTTRDGGTTWRGFTAGQALA